MIPLAFGIILLLFGAGWAVKLAWVEYPELTERMIWIHHWNQCLPIVLLLLVGFVLCAWSILKGQRG